MAMSTVISVLQLYGHLSDSSLASCQINVAHGTIPFQFSMHWSENYEIFWKHKTFLNYSLIFKFLDVQHQ